MILSAEETSKKWPQVDKAWGYLVLDNEIICVYIHSH